LCLYSNARSKHRPMALLSALAGLVLGLLAFRLAGFLGVAILVLLISFIAVRIDLEKGGCG